MTKRMALVEGWPMKKRAPLKVLLRQQMGFELVGWIGVQRPGGEGTIAFIYPYSAGDWALAYNDHNLASQELKDGFPSAEACLREIARELKRRKKAAA